MTFIKLYCHKLKRNLYINLEMMECISPATHKDGSEYVICFAGTQDEFCVYFESERARDRAEERIYHEME